MILRLQPSLRDYAWGSPTTIPEILGLVPTGDPVAEAWFGEASVVLGAGEDGEATTLAELVATQRRATLGAHGQFPFLVKLLAAAEPLSIQVHPDTVTAQAGFEREEAEGVAADSPVRVYRDLRAKPEAMVALETFEMLCGFRDAGRSADLIEALDVRELDGLVVQLRRGTAGLQAAVATLCHYDRDQLAGLITPLMAACADRAPDEHRRQCEWLTRIGAEFPDDVGVLFALLLDYHVLEPFDIVFVPPGVVHSYLSGSGLEIMESSDNVVRAGLTPKHIAVDELLRISRFEPGGPVIERGAGAAPAVHHSFDEGPFAVDLFLLDDEEVQLSVGGPEIVIVLDGRADIVSDDDAASLDRGGAVFIGASTDSYGLRVAGVVARVTAVERRSTPRPEAD